MPNMEEVEQTSDVRMDALFAEVPLSYISNHRTHNAHNLPPVTVETITAEATEEDEEDDTPQTCDNCGEIEDDCGCATCSGCDDRVSEVCSRCDECDGCCTCAHCHNCSDRYDRDVRCSCCSNCPDCCECYICDNCGERVEYLCGRNDCDNDLCESCCNCNDEPEFYKGYLDFHRAESDQFTRNPSKRFISLEIEVSSGDAGSMHPLCRKWNNSIVSDASLPDSGWEMNVNPSNGDVFLDHIAEIGDALKAADAGVDTSCGMHCHVDARDYQWKDLFKLCKLYGKIEQGLFSLVAKSRRGNHYSQFAAETYSFDSFRTFKADLLRTLYGWRNGRDYSYHPRVKKLNTLFRNSGVVKKYVGEASQKYCDSRYFALNLHSFFYRGTIEFRHHQGTTRTDKMQNWGLICAAIIDAAKRMKLAEIEALSSDSYNALLAVIPFSLWEYAAQRRESLDNR